MDMLSSFPGKLYISFRQSILGIILHNDSLSVSVGEYVHITQSGSFVIANMPGLLINATSGISKNMAGLTNLVREDY